MLALAYSAAISGIDAYIVRVQTDSSSGLPHFAIVGLPDRALNESRERVRAANRQLRLRPAAGPTGRQPGTGGSAQERRRLRPRHRPRAAGYRRTDRRPPPDRARRVRRTCARRHPARGPRRARDGARCQARRLRLDRRRRSQPRRSARSSTGSTSTRSRRCAARSPCCSATARRSCTAVRRCSNRRMRAPSAISP